MQPGIIGGLLIEGAVGGAVLSLIAFLLSRFFATALHHCLHQF